jgi:hypothetical protein|tara:strand:- start:1350 stop:2030 length:681 start_codon:yes stop_codon:yes gene_type:complete
LKLASFGCSFLFGFDGGQYENKDYSAGYHLSKLMNREWINNSFNGIGNDVIYEKLLTSHQQGQINPKDTFILIGWTAGYRRKIFVEDKSYITYAPSQTPLENDSLTWELEYFLSNINFVYYEVLKNINSTYYMLESLGYKYLMFDSLSPMTSFPGVDEEECYIDEMYVPKEFFDIKDSIKNYSDLNYYNWIQDNGEKVFVSPTDHHPNPYGAEQFSKLLYDEITNE